ncbi:MAG: hypothetical protein ACRDT4_18015 [Micromonosporaceae bacterium]
MPQPHPPRTTSGAARWVGAGLVDQIVIASANAATTLLALVLLDPRPAGLMVLSLGVGYFVMYLNRAFVGDVLLALSSRYDDARRDDLVRDGLATALVLALAGAGLFVVAWWLWPRGADTDLRDLIWIAPFLPAILLHDTARCGYLADRRPGQALVIDLIWVGTQAAAVTGLLVSRTVSPGRLLACWGVGATVGATAYLLRERVRPWRGSPRRWFAATRHLAGWFTAAGLVGQVHMLLVNFLVAGRLSAPDVSALRLTQVLLMQPVQNLIAAVTGMLVPRHSRIAYAAERPGDDGAAAAAQLRRQTVQLALGFAALGGLGVLVAWPVAEWSLVTTGKYAAAAPLALPVSLQAAVYLVQVPFVVGLRAMHRARLLFAQYVVASLAGLTGLLIGASTSALPGAAWGLTLGTCLGLATLCALYAHAIRTLRQPRPDPEPQPQAA